MSTILTIIGFGVVIVLFDTIVAYLLRDRPRSYARLIFLKLSFVSYSIWSLSGVFAARFAGGDAGTALFHAALAGVAVAAIEGTLGLAITSAIGPGKIPEEVASRKGFIPLAISSVIILGSIAGLIGGAMVLLVRG